MDLYESLALVAPVVGKKKLSKYFVIRGGLVTAFNGLEVRSYPVPCTLDFAPLAKAFTRAVKKCGKQTMLWIHPETGKVWVHGNDLTIEVECQPLEKFPMTIQTGFWFDEPKPKKPAKEKCTPPEAVWLRPDYLPYLAEARAFRPILFTSARLIEAANNREPLVTDVEVYGNYFLVAMVSVITGEVVYFEITVGADGLNVVSNSLNSDTDLNLLKWALDHFPIVTFNGNSFDIAMITLALSGRSCADLKWFANKIIVEGSKPWQVLKGAKVKKLTVNHIDLVEVLPLKQEFTSIKMYGGRLHVPKMQDLPFHPDTILSPDQICITRFYCIDSDCTNTAFAFVALREQIQLRELMGQRYGMDLRSKSDAQIAETVINGELQRLTFTEPHRVEIPAGTIYKYQTPKFVSFQTPLLNWVLQKIQGWDLRVNENGYIELPVDPVTNEAGLQVKIADATYSIGMGGLHSTETVSCHKADAETLILDRDVASYYPAIMLVLELFPAHLGDAFLKVFQSIVNDRLEAKKAKDKIKAEMLKIVVNGTYGKTSNYWSTLYDPRITLQVTITGQLCLLMLIEDLELNGFKVVSANTDGVTTKVEKSRRHVFNNIFDNWEMKTGFKTEETEYKSINARDVNAYIAIKADGKSKCKGPYFNPWLLENPGDAYDRLKKNPHGTISIEAAIAFLKDGTPVEQTVYACTDIRKFVAIRTVKGGAVQNGQYIGKAVRWYYAKGETGCFIYASSGKMVAETTGAKPCMVLPDYVPDDVDRQYYAREARKILGEIGALPPLIDVA